MDMCGKCVKGVSVLVRPAYDKAGNPVQADAVGVHGTPKCQYILQLLRCDEPENAAQWEGGGDGCWIGAHPSLGEKLAAALLEGGMLDAELGSGPVRSLRKEVTGIAGSDMRTDFVVEHGAEHAAAPRKRRGKDAATAPRRTVLEIKTVVDSDYAPETAPERKAGVFLGAAGPNYNRAALFPCGCVKNGQLGPDGERVVSARAIKHVRELSRIASGELTEAAGERLGAAAVFVVVRTDCTVFRPNAEACPSFARHLKAARAAGVRVLAHRVRWGSDGRAVHEGALPVDLD